MADWITTYGGIHFFPLDPEADKIEITDVAHALSLICRGNGHVKTFFFGRTALYTLCIRSGSKRIWKQDRTCLSAP